MDHGRLRRLLAQSALRILGLALMMALVGSHSYPAAADDAKPYYPSRHRVHVPWNSSWTEYQDGSAHNPVFPKSRFTAHWRVLLDGKVNGGLAIVDGVVYMTSFDRHVYALNLQDGYTIWKTQIPNVTMTTPAVSDGVVVVGTGTNLLLESLDKYRAIWGQASGDAIYALSAKDGHLLWKYRTVGEDMPSAAIYKGLVIFPNGDRHLYALDLHTGRPRWITPIHGNAAMSNAQIHNGVLFTTACESGIKETCETRATDPSTGKPIWVNPIGSQEATPTIADGKVFVSRIEPNPRYVPGGEIQVAAISERTGKTIWTHQGPTGPCPGIGTNVREISATYADHTLFQSFGCSSALYAMNPENGLVLWTFKPIGPIKMSPVVSERKVYVGDTEGVLYALDEGTGRLFRAMVLMEPFSCSPPVIVGRTMVVANGKQIYAIPVPVTTATRPEDFVIYKSDLDVPMHENAVKSDTTLYAGGSP